MFLMFSNHFDVLVSKIIFKKIIDMNFNTKNYLKNNHNHTVKQARNHAESAPMKTRPPITVPIIKTIF